MHQAVWQETCSLRRDLPENGLRSRSSLKPDRSTPSRLGYRYLLEKMGWQKTFTLSRRAKGCHLVTDEVLNHIRDGLNDVQVGFVAALQMPRCIDLGT